MDDKTKCFSVNLTQDEVEKLRLVSEKTEKSQNQALKESLVKGLGDAAFFFQGKSLFLAKVRIDLSLMMELGQKLQSKELKTDRMLFTYCAKDDPSVGVALWIANDRKEFDTLFAPHKEYYKEVLEITEVVTAQESMRMLMASMGK